MHTCASPAPNLRPATHASQIRSLPNPSTYRDQRKRPGGKKNPECSRFLFVDPTQSQASQILEKSEGDLSGFSLGEGGGFGMAFCAVAAIAAVGAGLYYNDMLPI